VQAEQLHPPAGMVAEVAREVPEVVAAQAVQRQRHLAAPVELVAREEEVEQGAQAAAPAVAGLVLAMRIRVLREEREVPVQEVLSVCSTVRAEVAEVVVVVEVEVVVKPLPALISALVLQAQAVVVAPAVQEPRANRELSLSPMALSQDHYPVHREHQRFPMSLELQ
jgi:hypothetical protein